MTSIPVESNESRAAARKIVKHEPAHARAKLQLTQTPKSALKPVYEDGEVI